MQRHYVNRNLPESMIPALKPLDLLKSQTALVSIANSPIPASAASSLSRPRAPPRQTWLARSG